MDYKRIKEIVFLLWDNETDYKDDATQIRIGDLFKEKHRVYNEDGHRLSDVLHLYKENPKQEFLFFIHLDHNNKSRGYKSFKTNSEIGTDYPNLIYYTVSRVPKKDIYEDGTNRFPVYDWEDIFSDNGIDKTFTPQTVAQMKQEKTNSENLKSVILNRPTIRYAIFTAIWEEFKEVEDLFDWEKELQEETNTIVYKIGKLKGTEKYVVGCFAGKTGMTEAAVICSELINRYEPEYLLMPGVCGGSDKTEFGDVIVANKVFLLGKGKIKDNLEEIEGQNKKATLYYNGEPIDISKITNSNGKSIRLVSEVFENEIETINLDEKLSQILEPKLKEIENKINYPYKTEDERIEVRFDPMACSLSVIDKEDYFEFEIKERDRKTKAVEMESYGVARAAQKANGGETKFLIFKSVMDKASSKTDKYKKKAAYTSAQFLKHLLVDNII
ncbi:MAG: hypothetical protein R2730_09540 [Chitinophagales bacterium]